MSVYRPKLSPHFHFDFVFKGQRHYGSTNCTSRREAEAYERQQRHKVANPGTARPPITVDEACGLQAEHCESLPGWANTRYALGVIVKGLGANRLLSAISQRDLQVYLAKRRSGRGNATINREINDLRAIWRRAQSARYDVGEMPTWRALYLPVADRPPRELSEAKEEAGLFAALADDACDPVLFALISGWRKSEMIGLRWSDCDLGRAEAVTRIKGGDFVVRQLDQTMVVLIARQPRVGPFVFTYLCRKSRAKRRAGQRYPLTVTALRVRWAEAKQAAGIEGLRFHDLRHTAATRILRVTQNLALAKEALKHRNIATTLRYAHVLNDDVRKAITAAQSRIIPEMINRRLRRGSKS